MPDQWGDQLPPCWRRQGKLVILAYHRERGLPQQGEFILCLKLKNRSSGVQCRRGCLSRWQVHE